MQSRFALATRALFLAALLALVAACSFSPVYSGDSSDVANANFAYGEPASRLEQIVYARLVQSFGRSGDASARLVTIDISSSPITPGTSVALNANFKIVDPASGQTLLSGTRTASASYVTSGQSLANQQASNEASERAARELGETIRLVLISFLAQNPG